MDRTVPTSGNEEISLYIRTYYSLLRSSREVPIRTVLEAHLRTNSALHVDADSHAFDLSAFSYAVFRLPHVFLEHVERVVMGQSTTVFRQHGYPDVESWTEVTAPARRRRSYWDGDRTLAVYIASRSDIDDLIPMLAAYQIERDKLQVMLSHPAIVKLLEFSLEKRGKGEHDSAEDAESLETISALSGLPLDDLKSLIKMWGSQAIYNLHQIATVPCAVSIQLLAGSFAEYKRATRRWWDNIAANCQKIDFYERPIYFLSSNTHSMTNLLSGHIRDIEPAILDYIEAAGKSQLKGELTNLNEAERPGARENLLYYALRGYEAQAAGTAQARVEAEQQYGLTRVVSEHVFDVEAQIVELRHLKPDRFDSRLREAGHNWEKLSASNALIINIDYPLGMAAYQILSEIARNISEIRGIYIMGKAATLNGRVGDVMIPNVVHDEHSSNTYLFENRFTAADVAPYMLTGAVLDNQKAITVPGTFLQNDKYMSVFYKEGYTDLEMEAGPYLNCVYELIRPRRFPQNEIVNLHSANFPIGILHYASDTPFKKGENLGSQNLAFRGMDATYATMVAILNAIFEQECAV